MTHTMKRGQCAAAHVLDVNDCLDVRPTCPACLCQCEIVGKHADGSDLAACEVINFRYYGGRCAADEVRP